MRFFTVLLLSLAVTTAMGQVTITGSVPAHNTTNVPLLTNVSLTFSAPIDTTQPFDTDNSFFTNVTSVIGRSWSADQRTVTYTVILSPSTVYFVLVYGVHPVGGGGLSTPFVVYWTTGASFPATLHSVSGTVTSGGTGISPANSIVGLTDAPFTGNQPNFIAATVTDGSGAFTFPYVADGVWYPLAAKDATQDGQIDPSKGDPLGLADSVVVSGANVQGITIPFMSFPPARFAAARDTIASKAAANTPPTRELREFYCWDIDTTAAAREYYATYTVPGVPGVFMIRMDAFSANGQTIPYGYDWAYNSKPFPGLATAALLDTVIARAERNGGRTFRKQAPPVAGSQFTAYARLGDLHNSEFSWLVTDTSLFYWGVSYSFQIQVRQDSSYGVAWKHFLFAAGTGQLLVVTGLEDQPSRTVPESFSLAQNYPNPFNPSTTISFSVPVRSRVTLQVYNLLGQLVATLVNDERMPGTHEATWHPALPSGIYFYKLEATGIDGPAQRFSQVRKMMLVK